MSYIFSFCFLVLVGHCRPSHLSPMFPGGGEPWPQWSVLLYLPPPSLLWDTCWLWIADQLLYRLPLINQLPKFPWCSTVAPSSSTTGVTVFTLNWGHTGYETRNGFAKMESMHMLQRKKCNFPKLQKPKIFPLGLKTTQNWIKAICFPQMRNG